MTTRNGITLFVGALMAAWLIVLTMYSIQQSDIIKGQSDLIDKMIDLDLKSLDTDKQIAKWLKNLQIEVDSLKTLYAGSGQLSLTAYAIAEKGRQ